MPSYYPIYLDVRGRRSIVFGGNREGERKVRYLIECGGDVTLFSPADSASPGLTKLASSGAIHWVSRTYRPGDLVGAWIAIVADTSDAAVNEAVYAEAAELNVVLNVMDVTPLCTFVAPAIIHRGDVTVAVSTAGTSPALARRLRERMSDEAYCRCLSWADLGPLLAEVRSDVRGRGVPVTPDNWAESITEELLDMFQSGDTEGARRRLTEALETGAAR